MWNNLIGLMKIILIYLNIHHVYCGLKMIMLCCNIKFYCAEFKSDLFQLILNKILSADWK